LNKDAKEFLKANEPVPATQEEKAALMKVSKKGIYFLLILGIVMMFFWIKEGAHTEDLGFIGVFLGFVAIVVFILDMKDKIKIKSYQKIYSTYVYVESSLYVNKANRMVVSYYDRDYGIFKKTKMNIDRVDVGGHVLQSGELLRIYVGEKNSEIYYIAMKND